MRVLFIGGNGNISAACGRLCLERGTEVFLLNRGRRDMPIQGAHNLVADINDPDSKIKQFVPDYTTRTPFHAGVRQTLAWFETDPKRQRIVDETNQTMDRYITAWRTACSGGR